jgi:hypothetical protein
MNFLQILQLRLKTKFLQLTDLDIFLNMNDTPLACMNTKKALN